MSQADEERSEVSSSGENSEVENEKLVPVAESIRYRKRAQRAEAKSEELAKQLGEAKSEVERMSGQLSDMEFEQKLIRKLAAEGSVDVETGVLLAKSRMKESGVVAGEVDEVVEDLKREKGYLFAEDSGGRSFKTAGVRQKGEQVRPSLSKAAQQAAESGNRADLQHYLKLRRNFV